MRIGNHFVYVLIVVPNGQKPPRPEKPKEEKKVLPATQALRNSGLGDRPSEVGPHGHHEGTEASWIKDVKIFQGR